MDATPHGAVIAEFPRTLSVKNWPFLVLILLLGGGPAGLMIGGGDIVDGLLVLAAVLSVPILILAGPYLLERLGLIVRVDSVHENGLHTSSGGKRTFWGWDSLTLKADYIIPRRRGIVRQRVQVLECASRYSLFTRGLLALSRRPALRRRVVHLLGRNPRLFQGILGWVAGEKALPRGVDASKEKSPTKRFVLQSTLHDEAAMDVVASHLTLESSVETRWPAHVQLPSSAAAAGPGRQAPAPADVRPRPGPLEADLIPSSPKSSPASVWLTAGATVAASLWLAAWTGSFVVGLVGVIAAAFVGSLVDRALFAPRIARAFNTDLTPMLEALSR